MKRIAFLAGIVAGFFLFGAKAALADDCAALGGTLVPALPPNECQVSSAATHNVHGSFTLGETLHLLVNAKVVTGATGINITINSGDFTMESGALIDGNVAGCNTGAPITVTLGDGNVNLNTGSIIRSDSCSGGAIAISTNGSHTVSLAGTVESVGSLSGTAPHQKPGGGTITVIAGCNLTVSDSGIVSSRGKDPGADLVHLSGCSVFINGLVESTGSGHVLPDGPLNHCNATPDAHPVGLGSPFYTACVEIWSATTVLIDGSPNAKPPPASHSGQVNADTGQSGGATGRGWIDIYAGDNITIKGMADPLIDPSPPPMGGGCSSHVQAVSGSHPGCSDKDHYAVHSNGGIGVNTDNGGLITIVSQSGGVSTSGQAVQASSTSGGGDGGDIRIEAAGDIDFGTASVQAKGATTSIGAGGHIGTATAPVRSYSGAIKGGPAGELNAAGGPGAGTGTVYILACDLAPTYTGAVVPSLNNNGTSCAPSEPTLPDSVINSSTWPVDSCSGLFCQIIRCEPLSPFQWFSPIGGTEGQPGFVEGQRGKYNKDGSVCGDVGYNFINDILTQNTVELIWDTVAQPNAAFKYTMDWKLTNVDPTTLWTAKRPQIGWIKDVNGDVQYMDGILCLGPANLPTPYGTLGADITAGDGTITIDTTFGGAGAPAGTPPLPPVPFPLVINQERMQVTGGSGTTFSVLRGQGGDHLPAGHSKGALVMSTPLPIMPPGTVPNPPYTPGNQAHMCIADQTFVVIGTEPVTGNITVEYITTVIDIGDGGIKLP